MRRMDSALGQDIDPDVFKLELAPVQIKRQILGKGLDVLIQRFFDRLKDREPPWQIRQGRIAGVAGEIVFLAPLLAGLVILGNGQARGLKLGRVDGLTVL